MSTEPTLEPTMAINMPGSITGPAIIDDLVARIVERLEKCGDLRSVDSYSSYSAEIQIRLQLADVDTTTVDTGLTVGVLDPAQPVHTITLRPAAAGVVDDLQPLEKPIDPAGFTQAPPQKRLYVSRVRRPEAVS